MPDNKLIKSILEAQKAVDISGIEKATRASRSILGAHRAIDISGIEEATRASRSIADLRHSIGKNSALMQAMESIRSNEDLRRAGILDLDHARFKLPENAEMARLLATCKSGVLSNIMARFAGEYSSLKRAMEIMRTPWLNVQDPLHSMGGFAALQGIGHALKSMPAFGHALGDALRVDLGDWRDPISWRSEIFTDLAARSDFYISLGFNPALTDFPLPAFEQSLDIAGLPRELPPAAGGQDAGTLLDEEEGLSRTNGAHDRLQRLERLLRKFIDERMAQAYGPVWVKQRLPNGLYDQWREKKRKAEKAGAEVRPLVEYADFTDYPEIICRGDNWQAVFGTLFVRKESVRESFQRLHPIRLDVAHSRIITPEDELLLRVEDRRLVKVMAKRKV